jgi:hypothetical protein
MAYFLFNTALTPHFLNTVCAWFSVVETLRRLALPWPFGNHFHSLRSLVSPNRPGPRPEVDGYIDAFFVQASLEKSRPHAKAP